MAKLIHSMIRVLDLDKSIDFYQKAFNLKEKHRMDFSEFTLVYMGNEENEFEIELTLNKGRTEPYSHGNGYGHVALSVDDLATEHKRIKALGFEPQDIVDFSPDGNLVARFFFMKDPDGYEIEVLQRQGHYQ